jgi:hypothetical protein
METKRFVMNINILPDNIQNLLKIGIFHFGSEDLGSFLEMSSFVLYNWIEDDSEPDKRERVIGAINEVLQTDPFHSFRTLALLLENLSVLETPWESFPSSVRDSLLRLFSSLSATDVKLVKQR